MTRNPSPVDAHVGRRIAQRREQLGMSQTELGAAIGPISFQQVQKYESGANRVSASRIWQIAQRLGVEVGYFWSGLNTDETITPVAIMQTPAGRRVMNALEGLAIDQLDAIAAAVIALTRPE